MSFLNFSTMKAICESSLAEFAELTDIQKEHIRASLNYMSCLLYPGTSFFSAILTSSPVFRCLHLAGNSIRLQDWLQRSSLLTKSTTAQPWLDKQLKVDKYIVEELSAGKLHIVTDPLGIHSNPNGLIPKKGSPQ
jgi:hypothetical protein